MTYRSGRGPSAVTNYFSRRGFESIFFISFTNKHSLSTLRRQLKEKQAHRLRPLNILQDVSTRWWSTFTMCDRLLVLRLYFDMMQAEGDLNCNLTPTQWTTVEHLRNLLKPFMQAQKVLEGGGICNLEFRARNCIWNSQWSIRDYRQRRHA